MRPQTSTLDPLLCDFELPLQAVYHPLGFSIAIATNSADVLAGAEESWGSFQRLFPEPAVQFRIGVLEGSSKECPRPPVCRGWRHLISRIADSENFAINDTRQGSAFAWLTRAAVENRAYLRYYFLEGTACSLLEPLYLTPIHGACVRLGQRGVLLCGDSGAGKSSLAYACVHKGWAFLSDDSACLIRKRKDRVVVGDPYRMRFRQSAVDIFPELKDQRRTLRATGQLAIELPTANQPGIEKTPTCAIDFIVFLNRTQGKPPGLWSFPKDKALQWLEQVACFGEKRVRNAQKASLRNLVKGDVLELYYSDLDSAVRQLEALVRENAPLASKAWGEWGGRVCV